MRKKIIGVVLFCFMTINVIAQTNITGTIENSSFKTLVINKVNPQGLIFLDSVKIVDGKFSVDLKMDQPEILALIFTPTSEQQVNNNWVTIHPKEKIALKYDVVNGIPQLMETKGSKEMVYMKSFFDMERSAAEKMNKYRSQYETAADADRPQIEQQFNIEVLLLNKNVYNLISEHKDYLSSALLITFFNQSMDNYMELFEDVSTSLSKKYAQNGMVKQLQRQVTGSPKPGKMAPDIALPDINGQVRSLSSLKGKVVLLDFWASWCRPCRIENPNVVKLYDTYKNKGFEIFSVSLDNNKNAWENAIKADNLTWKNHVSDLKGWSSEGGQLYGVSSIPYTVLIDRDGKIIAFNLRGEALKQKLAEIFN